MDELIGAESLSQRYAFLARLAGRLPDLETIVHDDACHLRLMAESKMATTDIAKRLVSMKYIVDEYHASGHVGKWCSTACLPGLASNKDMLRGFPTNICEIMNSELSPLGHTVHHMGRWVFQLAVQEYVDVLNMKTLQNHAVRRKAAERKASRDAAKQVCPPCVDG